jgi:hypothetical protein
MAATFRGEGNSHAVGSGLVGARSIINNNSSSGGHNGTVRMPVSPPLTPPSNMDGDDDLEMELDGLVCGGASKGSGFGATAWMEIWDFVGGASFRAFVADNGDEKSLFTFFDAGVVGSRDLKQALVALIELAEGPLECSTIVLCVDRRMSPGDAQSLLRNLQWVGFENMTLDHWTGGLDAVSRRWLFVGMEL